MAVCAKNLSDLSVEQYNKFFESIDHVLLDCDGVLWLYNEVIPGAPDVVKRLSNMGKKVYYVTNNSTKTRKEFVKKCIKLGFVCTLENILSSAYLSACYLHELGFKKRVYIIGQAGIAQELDEFGIQHNDIGPDTMTGTLDNLVNSETLLEKGVGAVVVGFDPHFSFPKMLRAASYLSDPTCLFLATNTDERFPITSQSFSSLVVPGTGSLVKAIETCAEREAIKIGKPHRHMCEVILKRYKVDPSRTLMVGDRCNTDILMGKHCGFKTLLVLTGVTKLEDVKKWEQSTDQLQKDLVPDFYLQSLGDLKVPTV